MRSQATQVLPRNRHFGSGVTMGGNTAPYPFGAPFTFASTEKSAFGHGSRC
jgi:hypothetical protein